MTHFCPFLVLMTPGCLRVSWFIVLASQSLSSSLHCFPSVCLWIPALYDSYRDICNDLGPIQMTQDDQFSEFLIVSS